MGSTGPVSDSVDLYLKVVPTDEDGTDGEWKTLLVDVCGVLVVEHIIELGNVAVLVADDGELESLARDLVNVSDPAGVRVDRVGRETKHGYATGLKVLGESSGDTELGGADG